MTAVDRLTGFLRRAFQDRFKRYLIISLIVLGSVLVVINARTPDPAPSDGFQVHFFHVTGCSHCDEQRPFNAELATRYDSIAIVEHDALISTEHDLLQEMLTDRGIDTPPEFPVTIFENQVFMGWDSEDTTGMAIEEALQQCLDGECPSPASKEPDEGIDIPLFGRIMFANYSLAALAVILGFVDGFNPCALWVLIYLISLVVTLRDRRRIWLIVGTFVLASGVIYFLILTAWLNAFLLIGFVRPVMIIVGLVALGGGIWQIGEVIRAKGEVVCEVTSEESREKTMARMQRIVSSPISIATIGGIIGLAFVVNLFEFACSVGIPAVFTHVLALSDLTTFHYYGYILLYVFFFMLVNLVIFGGAAFAMTSSLGVRYAKYARPVGAVILIVLGALLLFAPGWLR